MTGLEDAIIAAAAQGAITGTRQALEQTAVAGVGPLLYSPAAAGEVLGCSERRVYELIDAGEIATVNGPGRGRQITRRELVDYVDRLVARAARPMRGVA